MRRLRDAVILRVPLHVHILILSLALIQVLVARPSTRPVAQATVRVNPDPPAKGSLEPGHSIVRVNKDSLLNVRPGPILHRDRLMARARHIQNALRQKRLRTSPRMLEISVSSMMNRSPM